MLSQSAALPVMGWVSLVILGPHEPSPGKRPSTQDQGWDPAESRVASKAQWLAQLEPAAQRHTSPGGAASVSR